MAEMKLDADRIRTLRERRAWSQEHLAAVAGVSVRTLQRIEAGAGASHDTCLSLAAALDVPVGELTASTPQAHGGEAPVPGGTMPATLPPWLVPVLLAVLLVVWFGYTVGKDMALRDNRADAACAKDAAACERPGR